MKVCCGCMDRGAGYVCQHALCFGCSFGTLSAVVSEGEWSKLCCGGGLMLGVGVGMGIFGGPVLPCAVKVRRKVVERYGISEVRGESEEGKAVARRLTVVGVCVCVCVCVFF